MSGGCSGIKLKVDIPGCLWIWRYESGSSDNGINFKLGRMYLNLKDVPNTEKYLKEYLKGKTKKEFFDKIVAAFKSLEIKN